MVINHIYILFVSYVNTIKLTIAHYFKKFVIFTEFNNKQFSEIRAVSKNMDTQARKYKINNIKCQNIYIYIYL